MLRFAHPGVERFWCQWVEPYSTPELGREYSAETIFGGCDEELCEEVVDVVPLYWWPEVGVQSLAFLVDGFFYNDKRYVAGFAHVDTGFPIVQMPLGVFEYVFWDVNLKTFQYSDP
ncbi:hypothetical protein M3Y99_00111900 [Aphelenchoides fujianensis]|nr:hypothetical protein M3Y99_00111900 [Aphelenchoides fujianensis]